LAQTVWLCLDIRSFALVSMEGYSAEELKTLKRDASIREREAEYEKKRREDEERKRTQLEEIKAELERVEQQKLKERMETLKKRAAARAEQAAVQERLNQKREANIAKRHATWLKRTNFEIQEIKKEQEAENQLVKDNWEAARERKRENLQNIADKKSEAQAHQLEMDWKRAEKISEKANRREIREITRVDQIKTEAQQELQVFIQNPCPVPLKQVLAGRVRPVPSVTELLAAHKDQREELKDLESQDIPMRALLRNQTLFQYVRDIQMKAESDQLKPPEPTIGDSGRGAGRATRRSSSPTKAGSPSRRGASRHGMTAR